MDVESIFFKVMNVYIDRMFKLECSICYKYNLK